MATFSGYVRGNGYLNLRENASSSANVIGQIPKTTQLVVTTCSAHDWFITTYGDKTGYVSADYISITQDGGSCHVIGGSLNIRKIPNTSGTRIYGASTGTSLRLLDTTSVSGWYRVSGPNGTGWGMADFLVVDSAPGSSANTLLQLGDEGDEVYALQQKLMNKRYYYGHSSGVFDSRTEWAVKYFQHMNDLTVNGIVNDDVMELLNGSANKGVSDQVAARVVGGPIVTDMKMNTSPWVNHPFDATNTAVVEKIGDSGNAPTAIAIAFSSLWGTAITPPVIADWAKANNYRDENGVSGVTDAFFAAVATEWDERYAGIATSLDDVKNYINQGGLCVARLTYNAAYPYCSTNGATYVVIYKVDNNYIYLVNSNAGSNNNIPVSQWGSNWIKEVHKYGIPAM